MTDSVRLAAGPAADDPRLVAALDEYLTRAEAGNPPDREEFLRRHPEVAGPLAECLDALKVLGADGGPGVGRVIDDFRILRELGRGGMGVVYEAEQLSLGRRVALKVLPAAATLDARQRQRFQNEARAAASLDHPNVVPVYGVGCAAGVHYYAMRLIEGWTLAELAAGDRGADHWRRAAEWGAQAAEALEYAHSMGVVHRDVKPANLMVDDAGVLWVADFGLARVVTNENMTGTGDLIGTLRYMSPEQAQAQHGLVDHRSDVYSLGATLYELLGGQPAFAGDDPADVTRRILAEDPAPLRGVALGVPRDLETVVLKCLEKSPADRYVTAGELAADLRRFLGDWPVQARRPSLVRRARKWAWRNRAAVWAAAAVLLVALALGAGVGVLRLQQQAAAEREAVVALDEAARLAEQGKPREALLAARRGEPLLRGGLLSAGLAARVRQCLSDREMVVRIEAYRLRGGAIKDGQVDYEAPSDAYEQAFREYGLDVAAVSPAEAAERVQASGIRADLIAALDDWARLDDRAWVSAAKGRSREALRRQVRSTAARATESDPWWHRLYDAEAKKDVQALRELAAPEGADRLPPWALIRLARALEGCGEKEEALTLLAEEQRRRPSDFWLNGELGQLSSRMSPPRREDAVRYHSIAVALQPDSAAQRINLGIALHDHGRLEEAIACYRKASDLDPNYVVAHNNLGLVLRANGQLKEAIARFRKATDLDPKNAMTHSNLGIALHDNGQSEEAISCFRKATDLDPNLAMAHGNLGAALAGKGEPDAAIPALRRAIALKKDYPQAHYNLGLAHAGKGAMGEAVAEFRRAIALKKDYAEAHYDLGNVLLKKGELGEAEAELRQATALKKDFAGAHNSLGIALRNKGRLGEGEAQLRRAIALKKDFAEAHYNLGVLLEMKGATGEAIAEFRRAIASKGDDPDAHYNLGTLLLKTGELNGAAAEYSRAIAIKEDYPEAHCRMAHALAGQGKFSEALLAARRGHELGSRRAGWSLPSAQWVKEVERLVALDAKLPGVLSGKAAPALAAECLDLAILCREPCKRLYAGSASLYADAFSRRAVLASDLAAGHRYNAACAAALAGCGQGNDKPPPGAAQVRMQWRRQSLTWLSADLRAWRWLLDREPAKTRNVVTQQMRHWLADSDFAGVRGVEALQKFPPEEAEAWHRLWCDAEGLRRRAEAVAIPEMSDAAKRVPATAKESK